MATSQDELARIASGLAAQHGFGEDDCPSCDGTGTATKPVREDPCGTCDGRGKIWKNADSIRQARLDPLGRRSHVGEILSDAQLVEKLTKSSV